MLQLSDSQAAKKGKFHHTELADNIDEHEFIFRPIAVSPLITKTSVCV